jgi:hypothetical protein
VESSSGSMGKLHDAGVDRGGFACGVLIDGRIFGDEGVHVGDADHDLDAAVGQALGDFDLVEVFRGVVVDGRPEQAAQIPNVFGYSVTTAFTRFRGRSTL